MECIRFEHISKKFGEVLANDDVSFSINEGEILSILGENGSGKTTLLNVLNGIYQPDAGTIFIKGKEASIHSPKDAYANGLGMVHQHYKLVEAFSAIENIVLGLSRKELLSIYERIDEAKPSGRFPRCRIKDSRLRAEKMVEKYGFSLDLGKTVKEMSVSEKQTLEIVKALFRGVEVLILDEPTAVLTPQETRKLFQVIANMKEDGKTVIIITHKLNEVMEISDRIAVLRKGKFIDIVEKDKTTESSLAEMMVGEKVDLDIKRSALSPTGIRLSVQNLSVFGKDERKTLDEVSFELMGSEILGVAGVSGSGQKELLEAIGGIAKQKEGKIIFVNPKENKPVTFFHKDLKQIKELAKQGKFHYANGAKATLEGLSKKEIIKQVDNGEILFYEDEIIDLSQKEPLEIRNLGIKLSFVPEDRLGMGLVGEMDVVENMMLRSFRKGKGRMLNKERPTEVAERVVSKLDVKTPSLHTEVRTLSGGNIQKILVGRELSSSPKILMIAYPVRGLDINSTMQIYSLLDEEKQRGTAILYVGEDLDALLALCDRIMVLCQGKVTGIVDARKTSKEEIGLLMSGGSKHESSQG